jgi:membrane-bound metal-dependent hydrolase YbcI (DUF457 family)
MFAVGHLALGYLIGKASSKILNIKVEPSLLFLFAVLPDIDFLIPFIKHRGPTHSLILLIIAFIPSLLLFGRKTILYAIVYLQHLIPGDYMTAGGIQLLWPINTRWYSLGRPLGESTVTTIELVAFAASILLMWKTKDLKNLFHPQPLNYILLIPLVTLSLPIVAKFPLPVPIDLISPHLAFMALFTTAIFTNIKNNWHK